MKKKITLTTCAVLFVLVSLCIYFFIFRKPQITVTQVAITDLLKVYEMNRGFLSDEEIMDAIPYFIELSEEYSDIQNLWGNEDLPSYNPEDYAKLSFQFSASNTTIFDYIYKFSLINTYDKEAGMAIVSIPPVTTTEIKRLGTTHELECSLYIYIGDKSQDEIEAFVDSIEFQVCFENKVYKSGSILVNPEAPDIKYIQLEE